MSQPGMATLAASGLDLIHRSGRSVLPVGCRHGTPQPLNPDGTQCQEQGVFTNPAGRQLSSFITAARL